MTSPETGIPELAAALNMQPHPEGGWFVETWTAPQAFHPDGYPGPRAAASAIYFLLTPGDTSAWHTVRSDELWLWHRGGPLDLLLGGDGNSPSPPRKSSASVLVSRPGNAPRPSSPAASGRPPDR